MQDASIHQSLVQAGLPVAGVRSGQPFFSTPLTELQQQQVVVVLQDLYRSDLLTALETERNRRVDEAVGKTRSKLMTIAVCVDILIDHALGVQLTQTKRDTLLASQADLDDVVSLYTRAGQLGARIRNGETIEDITRDELWN